MYHCYERRNIFELPIVTSCKAEFILDLYNPKLNSAYNFTYNSIMKFNWDYVYKLQTWIIRREGWMAPTRSYALCSRNVAFVSPVMSEMVGLPLHLTVVSLSAISIRKKVRLRAFRTLIDVRNNFTPMWHPRYVREGLSAATEAGLLFPVLLLLFRGIPRQKKDVNVSNIFFCNEPSHTMKFISGSDFHNSNCRHWKASTAYLSHCSNISFGKLKKTE
jgi:hypothetical protein